MNRIHYLIAHAFNPFLLDITFSNAENIVRSNLEFDVSVYIVVHATQVHDYSNFVSQTNRMSFELILISLETEENPKEWHGLLLDKGVETIKGLFENNDILIISDSDFIIGSIDIQHQPEFSLTYHELRPMKLNKNLIGGSNVVPHPCLIFAGKQLAMKLLEYAVKYSFRRRRSIVIGVDICSSEYGADTCDYALMQFLKHEKAEIHKCRDRVVHLNGCTELLRKMDKNHLNPSVASCDQILEIVTSLDEKYYHDGGSSYYTKALINNVILCDYFKNNIFNSICLDSLKKAFAENEYYRKSNGVIRKILS